MLRQMLCFMRLQAVSVLFPFSPLRKTRHLSPEGVWGRIFFFFFFFFFFFWGGGGGRGKGGSHSPLKDFKWGTVEN